MKYMRLGDLLVDAGVITEDQLMSALKSQKESKRRLGDELIQTGVITERQRQLWAAPGKLEAHIARQAIPREMHPDDMVGPCLFLASDASAMLTAQTLIVDGGLL